MTYNFFNLRANGEITSEHYQLLSWVGYSLFMYQVNSGEDKGKYYPGYLAYSNACRIIGVKQEYLSAVSSGNIEGLQNYNRLAYPEFFSKNIAQYLCDAH